MSDLDQLVSPVAYKSRCATTRPVLGPKADTAWAPALSANDNQWSSQPDRA